MHLLYQLWKQPALRYVGKQPRGLTILLIPNEQCAVSRRKPVHAGNLFCPTQGASSPDAIDQSKGRSNLFNQLVGQLYGSRNNGDRALEEAFQADTSGNCKNVAIRRVDTIARPQ